MGDRTGMCAANLPPAIRRAEPVLPPQGQARAISRHSPELVAGFVVEARERLDTIQSGLLALRLDAGNLQIILTVFRHVHTIAGVAGFLELNAMRAVSHEMETVLDLARQAKLALTTTVIDILFEGVHFLHHWVNHLELDPAKPPAPHLTDVAALVTKTRALTGPDPGLLPAGGLGIAGPD
ncbi:MAG TPA: Hpt domain-containing protein [Bryobacteraceae bacterium]|nr:Hpt domain-containing protein [Bryobacteraceae bacterium]